MLLSPLTSDLALRGWQNGALLDWELLPAPFRVTDYFGFGQESVEEGHAAGWKVFFLRLAPLFSDFGPGFEVVVEGRAVGRGCDEHWLLVLDWEGKRDLCFCLVVWLLTWSDRTD